MQRKRTDAEDTASSSAITDHPFVAPEGEPWGLCVAHAAEAFVDAEGQHFARVCRLAQSAHARTSAPYNPAVRAVPWDGARAHSEGHSA